MKYTGPPIPDIEALALLLRSTPAELSYLFFAMDDNVKEHSFPKKSNPHESRDIASPSKRLKFVQKNIKDQILTNYPYENYVYGLGGNTLKDHALIHQGNKTLVQIDIRDFYPSVNHKLIHDTWIYKFGFSPHIAGLLTKLTTMHGGLVQGFPTSSHLATIAAEDFALAINNYCHDNSMKFTQYVDDFNISGQDIDYRMIFKRVVSTGRLYGLSIKKKKTKVNHGKVGKQITGVSMIGQQTRATKVVRQRAIDALKDLAKNPEDDYLKKRVAGYKGFLKHLNSSDGKKYIKLTERPESPLQ